MGALLEVQELHYSYGARMAVRGVSFSINPGEIFGLLGPNGAGKTTTISCISGHLSRYHGRLTMMGQTFLPGRNPKDRGLLGFVPQELAIYETLTGLENILLFAKLAGVPPNRISETSEELLSFAGLETRKNDLVKQYSGGMKRRLNLVCGMVQKPPLVLMDEPTVGVDPQSRNHLFDSIESLRNQGVSVLYTTHYMEEAERLCDRVAIMNEGCIMALGSPSELKGSVNSPDGTLEQVFLQLTGRSLRDDT